MTTLNIIILPSDYYLPVVSNYLHLILSNETVNKPTTDTCHSAMNRIRKYTPNNPNRIRKYTPGRP